MADWCTVFFSGPSFTDRWQRSRVCYITDRTFIDVYFLYINSRWESLLRNIVMDNNGKKKKKVSYLSSNSEQVIQFTAFVK